MDKMIDRFPYRENDPVLPCDNCGRDIGQDEVICRKCYDILINKNNKLQKKIDKLEEELAEIKNRFEL